MFKPLTRSAKTASRSNGGFAETQFLHSAGEDDYSGFAPTQMFGEDDLVPEVDPVAPATPAAARAAASSSHTVLERAAAASAQAPADDPAVSQARATSQWVAAQEAKAHEAANQARAVIAAQRRAEEQLAQGALEAETAAPRTGLARLRAAFERLLPGDFKSLLPLFIGVSVTVAMISAVLPMFDRP
jgi:hypothetical protein